MFFDGPLDMSRVPSNKEKVLGLLNAMESFLNGEDFWGAFSDLNASDSEKNIFFAWNDLVQKNIYDNCHNVRWNCELFLNKK